MNYRNVDPFSAEYRRPEPWVLGVVVYRDLIERTAVAADFRDQGCDAEHVTRYATHLEVLELAAKRIRGAGIFTSHKAEYVGEDVARLNAKRFSNGDSFMAAEVAVIIAGASETQFSQAYNDLLTESEPLAALLALQDSDRLASYNPAATPQAAASRWESEIFAAYQQDSTITQ